MKKLRVHRQRIIGFWDGPYILCRDEKPYSYWPSNSVHLLAGRHHLQSIVVVRLISRHALAPSVYFPESNNICTHNSILSASFKDFFDSLNACLKARQSAVAWIPLVGRSTSSRYRLDDMPARHGAALPFLQWFWWWNSIHLPFCGLCVRGRSSGSRSHKTRSSR